ncbi:hypothetical protein BC826DRAFT_973162 [Russula brevipes]|nr:hypothetical protein BC826DRAFT_973162 [Russula brevipes]
MKPGCGRRASEKNWANVLPIATPIVVITTTTAHMTSHTRNHYGRWKRIDDEEEEPGEIADAGGITVTTEFREFSIKKYTKEKNGGAHLRSRDDQGQARRCRGTKGKARKGGDGGGEVEAALRREPGG